MKLHWRIFQNPLTNDNLALDLELGRFDITAASFQTLATSGFGPGALSLNGVPRAFIFNCLNNWLMKRVTATDGAGFTAYEGFIAEMRATVDNETFEVLVDSFASRLRVMWTEADPLHPGSTRDNSTYVPNNTNANAGATAAQAKYGIKEEEMDLSGKNVITRAQAVAAAQTYLNQLVNPLLPSHKARGESDTAAGRYSIDFTLWGYMSTLAFLRDNTAYKKAVDIKTIIRTELTGNIGSTGVAQQFISKTDLSGLKWTGTAVPYNASGGWQGLDQYFTDLLQYGSPTNLRLIFQVWEDRKAYLSVRPTSIGYFSRGDDTRIWSGGRGAIQPWRLRAGQYMVAEDFPAPLETFADVDSDPRAYMIESTDYDDLTGAWGATPAKRSNLPIFLGRLRRGKKILKL